MNLRVNRALFGLAAISMLAGLVLVPEMVKAANPPAPSSLGLTVSPPSYELSANPGDVIEDQIRITNESASAVTFEVEVQDFKVEGTEGSVDVANDSTPSSASKWFSFPKALFKLNSKESTFVAFKITVPKSAEPGGHFSSILFRPKVVADSTSTGAKVIQRVGSLILMRVSGDIKENGAISKLSTKTFVGQWNEVIGSDGKTKILVANEEKLDEERPRWWFSQGPVAFDVSFKNSGNVHFKPAGTLTIYNMFGRKVETLTLDARNVFPSGERRITVIWPQKSLWGFWYKAQVAAVYGSQNKVLTAETHFIGFPFALFIAIVVIFFLLILVRKRLGRAFGILVRGQ